MEPGLSDAGAEPRRRRPRLASFVPATVLVLLLSAMAAQLVAQAWGDSLTFDEVRYIQTGSCAYASRTIDLEVSNPPAHKLLAGGAVILLGQRPPTSCSSADAFFPSDPIRLRRLILAARLPQVVLAVLLAGVAYLWSRALFGVAAGLLTAALLCFEPTLLAHGHLVTGDLGVSLAFTACLAAHWAWTRQRRRRWLFLCGGALGFGLLSKPSVLMLIPVLLLAEVCLAPGPARERLRVSLPPLALVLGCAWLEVCAVYVPFVQSHGGWPAPLSWLAPPSWFASLADVLGGTPGHVSYLNGTIRPADQPFRTYFLEALALKTTLGLLLLAAWGGLLAARRRDRCAGLYLGLPIALVVLAASAGAVGVGVRYLLPAYPLLAILGGSVLGTAAPARLARTALAGGAAALAIGSSVHSLPNHLGYFNELAGSHPERYLSDSNLDWGQDAWRLRDWWEAEHRPPLSLAYFGSLDLSHYGIAGSPVWPGRERVRGLLAVSLTRLTVIGDDVRRPYAGHPYTALQHLDPVTRIGTSMLILDLDRR